VSPPAPLLFFGLPVSAEIGAAITGCTAIIVGIIGLRQYYKSERWKRAEFAIQQVAALSTDSTFSFCCRAIDWGVGPLIIPDKYRALFREGQTTIEHDWFVMAKALRPSLHPDWALPDKKEQFLLYRYAFDDFFAYLDTLAMYEQLRVVKPADLSPLDTYFQQLVHPKYWKGQLADVASDQVFGDFIKTFYSDRLWKLIQRRVGADR
jgi:hypothetical protein